MKQGKRIGILGGTFDPIHMGHITIARSAISALELDQVLFVVAHSPWQKTSERDITDSETRLRMVEAAIADRDDMAVSRIEIDRGGPTYTIDTVDELVEANPGTKFWLLVGSDIVRSLQSWHRYEELASKIRLAVFDRPGYEELLPDPPWEYDLVDSPPVNLSSTLMRERLRKGLSVEYLVPDGVIEIYKRELAKELS